jgi:hypothetical protein
MVGATAGRWVEPNHDKPHIVEDTHLGARVMQELPTFIVNRSCVCGL